MNTGHGHVYPREDGLKVRCGGPPFCNVCRKDFAKYSGLELLKALPTILPSDIIKNQPIAKWEPDTDPHQARRVGKTLEELGELTAVLARIQIQGLDAIDPGTGKTNRQRLMEESADVATQIDLTLTYLSIDQDDGSAYAARRIDKERQMREWEAHF